MFKAENSFADFGEMDFDFSCDEIEKSVNEVLNNKELLQTVLTCHNA